MKPSEKRRYIERRFNYVRETIRKILKVPMDEYIIDFFWDKKENTLILKTLKDFNEKEGDI